MHYKYVWRGLEEMFEFAHLHNINLLQLIKPIKRLTCKLPCESYPKIVHSLNMKNGRSDTPLS